MLKPEKGEKLDCHKYDRDEASMYRNHAIAVYTLFGETLARIKFGPGQK